MTRLTQISLPALNASQFQPDGKIEWLQASDGTSLACRIWPGRSGRPVILYLHGIEGHSQWFQPTAHVLQQRGFTIYAPDRRGSGLNPDDRGHLPGLKTFILDVENILRRISLQHPAAPIFLFANCWSAKAAAVITNIKHTYADGQPVVPLSGLIMTCPAIVNKVDFDLGSKLKIALSTFAGTRLGKTYWPVPLTTEMLTDNDTYIEYLNKDPLRLRAATSRFFRETFVLGLLAQVFVRQITLPVLVLQSERDRIVDIPKLQNWYNRIGSKDKQWRTFADATHSLDFDRRWFDEYTDLLSEWMLARTVTVSA